MNYNPIRRSQLKRKPRSDKRSMPWRREKVRLGPAGMKELREDALYRSCMQCENSVNGRRCPKKITWMSFHLAHIVSRGRGGSDAPENVLAVCQECHDADTKNRRKLQPHAGWIAKVA
jgi:cytochrome c553